MDNFETTQKVHAQESVQRGLTLARIESDLKHAPTHNDINNLHHRVTELLKSTSESSGRQDAYNQLLDRLNQYMMKQSS